ncbi:Ig domain-containing protein [Alicyclobacillus sp. ALC3]|uniref:Ig domain-containing protein n=1 Tax=Alicyclobacillus sp. ALC3 TaxID=2796143 RepID=UPI0023798E09|nr:Ig domain-containing protein [Alicyclobacillus sp. ALC3]WDL95303.1 putative Ig domain-containing protein [Alicyclobacillus sp. ALC3]
MGSSNGLKHRGKRALTTTSAVMIALGTAMNFAPPQVSAQTTPTPVAPTVQTLGGTQWVLVSSAANLLYIDQNQEAKITTTSTTDYLDANIRLSGTISMAGVTGWVPIGDTTAPFVGTLDGAGHQITGLSITGATANGYEGLVGLLGSGGVIEHLGVTAEVTGGQPYAGGLVGYEAGGLITDSYATGNVNGQAAGGLVGWQNSGTIQDSYATGSVNGTGSSSIVGGLVGWQNSGTVQDSHATGSANGNLFTGGLTGLQNSGVIQNSYAAGSVSGVYAGGLVGYQQNGTVQDAYATGSVTGETLAGGLTGFQYSGTIQNSYATGKASGGSSANEGGLVGQQHSGTIQDSYATASVSGGAAGGLVGVQRGGNITDAYAGGDVNGIRVTSGTLFSSPTTSLSGTVSALTASQLTLQSSYAGFDFTSTWAIDPSGVINGGMPYLQGMYPTIRTTAVAAEVGTTNSQPLSASGGSGGDTWTFTSGSTSATTDGLSLSPSGVLSGVPMQTGTYSFSAQVTDSLGLSDTRVLTLDVGPALSPLTPVRQTVLAGWPDTFTFTEMGGYGSYTWSLASGTLPPGYTLTSGGVLSGRSNRVGTYSFTVRVTDSLGATRLESATWVIEQAVSPLTVQSITLGHGTQGSLYEQTLIANGGKPAYTWSLIGGSLPAGLVLNSDGVVQGTPTASGTYTFTVEVRDTAGHTATAIDTLTVEAGSTPVTPPVTPPQSQPLGIGTTVLPGATAGTAYSGTLTATGGDGTYQWSLASGALPRGLSLGANGTLFGTPQTMGMSTFTLRVTDKGGDVATKTFHLFVMPKLLPAYDRVIEVNGQVFSLSPSMVYNQTTYMPIWYVQNVLQLAGVNAAWNGNLNRWDLTVNTSSGAFAGVTPHLIFNNHGTPVYVNGVLVLHAPTVAHRDPTDGVLTTYMPIWYVQQVLQSLGITTTWNGHTWNFLLPGAE